MKSTTFSFSASDSTDLLVYRWWPDADVPLLAVVQIAHGMGEHAARYEPVAERLTAKGYAVYAHDQRGHGRTARTHADLGHFADNDGWSRIVRDLDELHRRIRGEEPQVPIFLLGHSMGSLVVQHYLCEYADGLEGAILSGSAGGGKRALRRVAGWLARIERLRVGRSGQSPLLRRLLFGRFNQSFEPARTEYDWLSRDEHEVDKYVADPLCGFVLSPRSMCDMLNALGSLGDPASLARIPKDLPVYIFSGSEDPAHAELEGIKSLLADFERAGLERVQHRIYAGGRHEMLNETNAEEVCTDLIEWLDSALRERGH